MKVLKIKIGNWNFGKLFKEVLKIRFGNWNLKKKIYLRMKFLKIGILKKQHFKIKV